MVFLSKQTHVAHLLGQTLEVQLKEQILEAYLAYQQLEFQDHNLTQEHNKCNLW